MIPPSTTKLLTQAEWESHIERSHDRLPWWWAVASQRRLRYQEYVTAHLRAQEAAK